ncbi:MAG: hypothetical protein ACLFVJ_10340 [Persicimonas sp.]
MAIKPTSTFWAAAAGALLLIGAPGCDEHPRPGLEERQDEPPQVEPVADEPGTPAQAGEEGAELSEYTGPLMEQCIEVVGRVMHCTSEADFNELLVGNGTEAVPGWTREELQKKAKFWLEPGAQRQTCEQLVTADQLNPFKVRDKLEKMAESANEQCVDFGELLLEMRALEALANVQI